jgi:hypothetical protein
MTPLILIGNDPTDSDWEWPHWFWLAMTPLILIGSDPLILIGNDPTDYDWQYNTD